MDKEQSQPKKTSFQPTSGATFQGKPVNMHNSHEDNQKGFPLQYAPAPTPSMNMRYAQLPGNHNRYSQDSRPSQGERSGSMYGYQSQFPELVTRKAFTTDKKWNRTHEKFAPVEAALNSYALVTGRV